MNTLNITSYERRHRRPVSDLLFGSPFAFTHLDWHSVEQWLNTPTHFVRLAWIENKLAGIIGVSAPVEGASWLRLLMFEEQCPKEAVLQLLWQDVLTSIQAQNARMIGAIELDTWLGEYLELLKFKNLDQIVTMIRRPDAALPYVDTNVQIKHAIMRDSWAILRVDSAAFEPPWQLSDEDLRYARRQSSNCAVAVQNDEIIGYHLSTASSQHGHLARLAVIPQCQGQGIGAALVDDMIRRFARRDIHSISVNTQGSNLSSQRLYARFGFEYSGFDLQYWQCDL